MLFNSYTFIFLFLPLTFWVFFRLGSVRPHYGAAWLTLASLFFYGWWNPSYLLLLLLSIGFNYAVGLLLAGEWRRPWLPKARSLLAFGIAVDLLLLCYYKYANFFLSTVNASTGLHWSLGEIILPLGISFYTFTQIAFLVDTYQGKVKEHNFIHYALFVTYFPHLIAGPVLHHKEMMPQFANPDIYRKNQGDIAIGLTFFAIGLFKKAVLADGIAPFANSGFAMAAAGQQLTFFDAWGAALAYTFQLYFDFSGYSDMAVGLSRMFGIRLPFNFDSPYKAGNIIDFWRRWHMTLSRFLRDYLYLPLGGNRKGKLRRYLNLMATMLLGGLWHGAGWTFVIWGALHGAYLMANHAWQGLRLYLGWSERAESGPGRYFAHALTFVAVVFGWVFFRAPSLDSGVLLAQGMLGIHGVALPTGLASHLAGLSPFLGKLGVEFSLSGGTNFVLTYVWVMGLSVIAFFLPNTQQFIGRLGQGSIPSHAVLESERFPVSGSDFMLAWRPSRIWAVATGVLLAGGLMTLSRVSEFLYFQF